MATNPPSYDEVYQKLTSLIAEKIDIDKSSIHLDSNLKEIGLDSLDYFDLVFSAEDFYKIKVPNNTTEINTVSDVTTLVHELAIEKKD